MFQLPRFLASQAPLGKKGEFIARKHLEKQGFSILATNYRNPKGRQVGEIDIVSKKNGAIVFVEVKTREGILGETFPEDSVTPIKLRRLERIAEHYLRAHSLQDTPYHFDIIAILLNGKGTLISLKHFEHTFL